MQCLLDFVFKVRRQLVSAVDNRRYKVVCETFSKFFTDIYFVQSSKYIFNFIIYFDFIPFETVFISHLGLFLFLKISEKLSFGGDFGTNVFLVQIEIMPREYFTKLGCRSYRNYTEESLEKAVESVINHSLSIRKAAEK